MANSYVTYTGDGATVNRVVTFPFLNRSHVTVQVDGVLTAFTWINDGLIAISPAPANGTTIVIRRSSSPTTPLVNFTVGFLSEADLDTAYLHAFYLAQEAVDSAASAMILDATQNWDAQSKRIKNLANGTASTDAINKSQLDAVVVAAGNVPTPANPGDNNKVLKASAGAFSWQAEGGLVLDTNPGLEFNAGALRVKAVAPLTRTATGLELNVMTGDAGAGGAKGAVPAPAAGDATKFLKGDATWGTPSATGMDVQIFTGSGTWTKPAGTPKRTFVRAWAGGGSGAKGSATTGGGGGGGGAYGERWLDSTTLGATESVSIGGGGAAQTTASTAGNTGGNTTFGSVVTVFGGGGGGFHATNGGGGGGGGGILGIGGSSNSGQGGGGGAPGAGAGGSAGDGSGGARSDGLGGGAGGNGSTGTPAGSGGSSAYGGAGAGGGAVGSTGGAGGNSYMGGAGGGGGADTTGGAGGTSTIGGNGGAGGAGAGAPGSGVAPGGGGGGSESADSGAGAAGRVEVYTFF